MLIVISGPGGVGKDTIISRLIERDPRLQFAVSYTTRSRRDYEEQDVHYTFVDEAGFERLVEQGELLEHASVNGHLYGTSGRRVEEALGDGIDVIIKPEVQGAEQVRQARPDGLFIFVQPPSMEELMQRRHRRGAESEEQQLQRQRLAELEMSSAERYDYVVVNDDLERTVSELLAIIDAERDRRVGSMKPLP
jgi:guanylate kinase